ncbi:MAG: IS256 family transposase [Firmicutes bacterium]|nr:IS256 family transposase [Bacillota bacterium]
MEDIHAMLKSLFGGTIEEMLEAEMEEHLGYDKHSSKGDLSGNSRNGYNKKTLQTQMGKTEIRVPRDRNGEFEPQLIGKYQTKSNNLEHQVIAMYQKGMSTRDIEDHLRDVCGVDASPALISRITDKILPQLTEWQSRPLESIYPIIYFDGIVFKTRKDNQIVNKCVYSVLGIDMDGQKDILGIWISENEGASFWASICSDLKKRGVTDIFIACHDNLKGLSEAINAVFPKTKQQLCIVHQIRNSTKFVSYKERKAICVDLKKIYGAVNLDDAEYAKEEFREKWDKKYPAILRSWDENWAELTTFFGFPSEIRHLIYTTNAVEAYHRMVWKFTKAKAIFPTDDSIRKVVFLSVREITKKWTMPARDWSMAYSQIMIYFADRFVA